MSTATLPVLLSSTDVGQWLNLSPGQVERMARRGQVPSIRLPNGDLLFDRVELLQWLDHLREQPREVRHAPA
jgi:hypothetical protein